MSAESRIKNVASYRSPREDILDKIKKAPKRVLDCGCNIGSLGHTIKTTFPGSEVIGWDYNPDAIVQAKELLDNAKTVDLNDCQAIENALLGKTFDLIIFGDVLEHLVDPWSVLRRLNMSLERGGVVLISLPNFGHWNTILNCILRRLPRNSRGIYDDTHLRNFMLKNLEEFESETLRIRSISRNLRLSDSIQGFRGAGLLFGVIRHLPWLRDLFTFQYLITLCKIEA